MNLLHVVLFSAGVLGVAYILYGRWLAKWLSLNPAAVTPAVELRDDVDYEPIEKKFLISQHFSAIAAAGPIVGPILAGLYFGWVPALLWILIGSIFIGGVYDITALTASIRHKARSIAEIVKLHISRRSYFLFLTFVWIALVYIVVAFTDVTAQSFVGAIDLKNGQSVSGGGIATSSLMYLVLPVMMGLALRFTKISLGLATLIFVPLVGVAIWAGQQFPLDAMSLFDWDRITTVKAWGVGLLLYCFAASIAPMWLLLQPRGHLGGYFLFAAMAGSAAGILIGGLSGDLSIQYPAFKGWSWTSPDGAKTFPLFPILFITIACGACSGFHSIIISGTTSKQLKKETDARAIGYGTMLLEGLFAVVALGCVMILAGNAPILQDAKPNFIYAIGLGTFLDRFGIPPMFVVSFGLMAFTTFVYDTLDVCTRLGRYIVQELTGWHDRKGRLIATALTIGAPMFFLLQTVLDAEGRPVPVWSVFWGLFGASNQLLAALTLVGITVWLLHTLPPEKRKWVPLVTGVPALLMYVMSVWALLLFIAAGFGRGSWGDSVSWVATVLVVLAALVLWEGIAALRRRPPGKQELEREENAPHPREDYDLWELPQTETG